MFRGEDFGKAAEKVLDWLFYAGPAFVSVFAIYVFSVATRATISFARCPEKFRYEEHEAFNFVEVFNKAKGFKIDGGTF